MSRPFDDVQRIVLHGGRWRKAHQLVLHFGQDSAPRHFLSLLCQQGLWPAAAPEPWPRVQMSLGLSRLGLERLGVPPHVLGRFALKAPAFHAGAALRAAQHLGLTGADAPTQWLQVFARDWLHGVLSLHATDDALLASLLQRVQRCARRAAVECASLAPTERLRERPDGTRAADDEQWVHFGYRDALSRLSMQDSPAGRPADAAPGCHAAGEFVLGLAQDTGANPWIGGPGRDVWPAPVRQFFRGGSFGVLHQIEQDVHGFRTFVTSTAARLGLSPELLMAKLCGRYPDGQPAGHPKADPTDDAFDYADDPDGHGCPFGSHARRMNPRGDARAHGMRARPLLRRGMPYTWPQALDAEADPQCKPRRDPGLMGQFFCASIEDQYEHLLGQWADRVPLGSRDGGGARDPLIGAHAPGDGPFEIPRADQPAIRLAGLQPFTRTLGVAYLFYPSLSTLAGVAEGRLWLERDREHM